MHTHESPVSRKRSAQIVGATILDFARARDEFTRGELSEESGLSQSILTRGLRTLIAEDRIRITREDKSKPGRPVQVLSYNPESELVIVVNVTQNANEVRVLDQQGNALVAETFDIDDEALESIIDATAAPIARFGGAVRSLVVAVEGVATGTDGDIVLAPWFSGDRRSLRRKLEARVGLPVLVDNDVNLRALGESRRRGAAGAADMLYFYVGASGVGAAPIVDGELRRGSDGRAGEIGFLPVFDDNLPEGDIGTFERRWSANGILDQLTVPLREKATSFRDLSVLEALRQLEHDSIAVARLRQQAEDAWFRALLICCCVLAPSTIVVAGAAAFLSDDALQRGQRYLADRSPYPPDLIRSTSGQDTLYLGSLHLSQVAATSRID